MTDRNSTSFRPRAKAAFEESLGGPEREQPKTRAGAERVSTCADAEQVETSRGAAAELRDSPQGPSSRAPAQAAQKQLPRARIAPRYVSKRTAMALLDLSLSGFRNWVQQGILPPPCAGTPLHEPRWCWADGPTR